MTASVYLEKNRLKKLLMMMMMKMIIIILSIMNKLQEMTVFHKLQIDFRCETKARKVMVDFIFHALYR